MSDVASRALEVLRLHILGIECTRAASAISSVVAKRLDILGHGELFPRFVVHPSDRESAAAVHAVLTAELDADAQFARCVSELLDGPS